MTVMLLLLLSLLHPGHPNQSVHSKRGKGKGKKRKAGYRGVRKGLDPKSTRVVGGAVGGVAGYSAVRYVQNTKASGKRGNQRAKYSSTGRMW